MPITACGLHKLFSDRLYSSCYRPIRKPDALHACLRNVMSGNSKPETETFQKTFRGRLETETAFLVPVRRQYQLPRSACRIGTDAIIPSTTRCRPQQRFHVQLVAFSSNSGCRPLYCLSWTIAMLHLLALLLNRLHAGD